MSSKYQSTRFGRNRDDASVYELPFGFERMLGGNKGGPPSGNSADQNPHMDGQALLLPPNASDSSPIPFPGVPGAIGTLSSTIPPGTTTDAEADAEFERIERARLDQEELVDKETNFWRWRNFTIPLFYFILGFALALRYPTVALRKFMIDELQVSPANQSLAMGVVMYIPFSLKIFFAFLSDGMPILGQRRKPYMLFGTLLAGITLGALDPRPNIQITSLLLFLATLGLVWCDTMVDTLVVERMRHEHGPRVGRMQTTCWMLRYAGMFIGILLGGWLLHYGEVKPQTLFLSLGMVLLILLFPALFPLADDGMHSPDGLPLEPPTFSENVSRIWSAVQLHSIWMPMIFVYIWNILPNDGDAWVNYLLEDLKFSQDQYSYILAIGTVSGALGAYLYRSCLRNTPLHPIFYVTIIVSALLSCIPFILILKENRKWGMPDLVFALGNEVINDVAGFIMYMPVLIMCSKLCPNQVEGSVYALTCMVNNIGNQIAMNFSAMLTDEFGVTTKNFDRLWELHLVVVLMMFIPLGFVWLCPNKPGDGNPDELRRNAERLKLLLESRKARRAQLQRRQAAADAATAASVEDEDSAEEAGDEERLLRRRAPAGDAEVPAVSSDEPASEEVKEKSKCGACCSGDDDAEEMIDESTVTEEEWVQQSQELEDQIEHYTHQADTLVQPTSMLGGGIFLFTIFASLTWSTIHAVWRISKLKG